VVKVNVFTNQPFIAFFLKPSAEKPKFNSSFYFRHHGSEPQPVYALRHLDPALPGSKNRYAVGLYDSYSPEILYGEVLLIPKWTQPTLSQEAIRQNGGILPPPEPALPTEFIIQLYNPDQQVVVRHKSKAWNCAACWEFDMPQQTFRQPSGSSLDRTLSDPAASDVTPKLKFNWRKDGRLSRGLVCYLSGKTINPDGSKKSKEPDITIAILQGFKEITLYEPHFYRVEMEDFKGLEIVLILGAVVIRDVYFGHLKDCFHVSDPPRADNPNTSALDGKAPPKPPRPQVTIPQRETRPPPVDPRTQWELDVEAAQLKQQTQAEIRERRRREKEEERRTRKFLQSEEKEARRRQAEIDQETERLKKLYSREEEQYRKGQAKNAQVAKPSVPPRIHVPHPNMAPARHQPVAAHHRHTTYDIPPSSSMVNLAPNHHPQLRERKSIFGFRKKEEEPRDGIVRKRSAVF
jgi:hypothetical protein